MCVRHICLKFSDDLSTVGMSLITGEEVSEENELFSIELNDTDEVIEILEEIAELVNSAIQYLRDIKIKRSQLTDFH